MLNCPYFHLTATIPEALRALFRSHQKTLYPLLMRLTARCILDLCASPKWLGAMPGILAVLHTWTGQLEYLARYVHRIAITSRRLLAMDEKSVIFQFKDRKAGHMRTCRLEGQQFMRRFLQHALPRRLHKVRYYGLWNPKRRELAQRVRQLLLLQQPLPGACPEPPVSNEANAPPPPSRHEPFQPICPGCGCRELVHVKEIPRPRIRDP